MQGYSEVDVHGFLGKLRSEWSLNLLDVLGVFTFGEDEWQARRIRIHHEAAISDARCIFDTFLKIQYFRRNTA